MSIVELLILGVNIFLVPYFIFTAIKEPTRRIMHLAGAFLILSLLILAMLSKFLMKIDWFLDNSSYIIIGMSLFYFTWLFIGSIVADKKENEEKLIFVNSLYTKKELQVKKYKRVFYYIFLIIIWLMGIYFFGGNILIDKLFN